MSYDQIWTALDGVAQGMTGAGQLVFEGETYEPREGMGYVECRMTGYTRKPVAAGPNPVFQEQGTYSLIIRQPGETGRRAASALADTAVNLFKRGMALSTQSNQSISIIGASATPARPDGDWITVAVTVNWFASDP